MMFHSFSHLSLETTINDEWTMQSLIYLSDQLLISTLCVCVIQAAPLVMLWEPRGSTTPWWPPSSPSWPARRNMEARNPPTRTGESEDSFCTIWENPQSLQLYSVVHMDVSVVYHFPSRAYHCGHTICSVLWLIIDSWELMAGKRRLYMSCFDVQAAEAPMLGKGITVLIVILL